MIKSKSKRNKPDFADGKTWKAYLILEKTARKRDYNEIGLAHAYKLISGHLGITKRTSTRPHDILHRLSDYPYRWISLSNDGAMQIKVKPLNEVIQITEVENNG